MGHNDAYGHGTANEERATKNAKNLNYFDALVFEHDGELDMTAKNRT